MSAPLYVPPQGARRAVAPSRRATSRTLMRLLDIRTPGTDLPMFSANLSPRNVPKVVFSPIALCQIVGTWHQVGKTQRWSIRPTVVHGAVGVHPISRAIPGRVLWTELDVSYAL